MKKDIDVLIDPPAFCEGKLAWVRWRKGLEKDDPEIPAIADAIKEADEVIQWHESIDLASLAPGVGVITDVYGPEDSAEEWGSAIGQPPAF